MISVNNLKTDSENDNEKAGIPSFPPPKPTTSYIDDLDFYNDFENEFPAIVYNDSLTSKLDLLTELNVSPQHINEFNLKDETSLSECDEEEQNVLNFNDLFSFNVIYPNNSKLDKDNYDGKVDIEHSSGDLSVKPLPDEPSKESTKLVKYQSSGILCVIVGMLAFTHMAPLPTHKKRHPFLRVQVVDFQGMPELMRDDLFTRIRMEHHDDAGVVVFTSQAWRRLFGIMGPLVWELILEFLSMLKFGKRQFILDLGLHIGEEMKSPGFARFAAGRKSEAHISEGQFVARMAERFGILTVEILGGLTVIAPKLPGCRFLRMLLLLMRVTKMFRHPCKPPPPPSAAARTIPQRLGRLEEDVQGLRRDVGSLRGLMKRSMTDQGRFSTWMISCMAQLMDASGLTYQAFDGTFRGSSPLAFQRCLISCTIHVTSNVYPKSMYKETAIS
ncbi:hypothetical protein Tco_0122602 [Tanacetum coccineum]